MRSGPFQTFPASRRAQYPDDLAKLMCAHWENLIGGQYTPPPLPSPTQTREVIEACYFASLEQEEARALQFRVCCAPRARPLARLEGDARLQIWRFSEPRPLTAQELRKLAPVTDFNSASILVEFDERTLEIVGIVNAGSDWESSRRGFGYRQQSPPNALNVRVDGPGRLAVFQGGYLFARLAEAKVSRPTMISQMEFIGLDAITKPGLAKLRQRVTPPVEEPAGQYFDFEYLAHLNVFVAIANTIESGRHGGTLLVADDFDTLKNHLKFKFAMPTAELGDRFVEFLNKRNVMIDDAYRAEAKGRKINPGKYLEYQDEVTALARSAAFIGRLSSVDGAVVMNSDLSLVGFGAEIVLENCPAVSVYELDQTDDLFRKTKKRLLNSERYGMRHRSAMRLCGHVPSVAAFVVSQDGGINLVFSRERKVYFRKGIHAVNTVMVGS